MGGALRDHDQEDAYIRLFAGARDATTSDPATNPEALTFVDADGVRSARELIRSFQRLPHRLSHTRYVLIRWPSITAFEADDDEGEQASSQLMTDWLEELSGSGGALPDRQTHLGIVRFRVGQPPETVWADPPSTQSDETLLARARAVEMFTLLQWGNGIWRPADYHYELPSGQHSGAFVRLADAFRRPRDAQVLASWLASQLRPKVGILTDSGTMTPLVIQLHALARLREGWTPGQVEVLDDYPRTRLDALRAARRLRGEADGTLGILSVSSSGRVRDLMAEALRTTAVADDSWALHVLADKVHSTDECYEAEVPPDAREDQRVFTWLGLADPSVVATDGDSCELCRDNRRAPRVRIDPRTFDTLLLTDAELVTPDTFDGAENKELWEAADTAGAIAVQVEPHEAASRTRPKGELMAVRVQFEKLLPNGDFLKHLSDRLAQLRGLDGEQLRKSSCPAFNELGKVEGVIVPSTDLEVDSFGPTWEVVRDGIGCGDVPLHPFDPDSGVVPGEFAARNELLVFSLGTVTGWTLRQLLIGVQDAWDDAPPPGPGDPQRRVHGLVLHARPPTGREWATISNSYERRLGALWLTYLPWRSPLDEEDRLLTELKNPNDLQLSEPAKSFLRERRGYCRPRSRSWDERVAREGEMVHADSVFWGLPPLSGRGTIRNQSLYGYRIGALAIYAAMGSAVHRRRTHDPVVVPRWRAFEMPAIVRSYYDALIVVAALRWLEPQEIWWGSTEREAINTLSGLVGRTSDDSELMVLVPELLLAAAQGKVPAAAVPTLIALAETHSGSWSPEDKAPIQLGLLLLAEAQGMRSSTEAPPAALTDIEEPTAPERT